MGAEGLDALLKTHADLLARGPGSKAWPRLRAALDQVAGQYDAQTARLYWYTDLEAAKAAAARLDRPILSLRLLGRLDEDLSCANSRLFRAVLYADPAVRRMLHEHFVLHWSSERPAPRMTIDYGDGRVLVRTITGNSAHSVLDAQGRTIDVIPGLWGPAAFVAALDEAAALAAGKPARPRLAGEAEEEMLAWDRERPAGVPTARDAARRTRSKMGIQLSTIAALDGGPSVTDDARRRAPDPDVEAIVARERATVVLSAETRTLLRAKEGPGSGAPDAGAAGDPAAEARFARKIARLEDSVARDQAFNRYVLQPRIRDWLRTDPKAADDRVELNRRLYTEAFLTPADDPWMGLIDAEVFTGQDRGGLNFDR